MFYGDPDPTNSGHEQARDDDPYFFSRGHEVACDGDPYFFLLGVMKWHVMVERITL